MGTGKEGEESRKRVKERIRGKMDRKRRRAGVAREGRAEERQTGEGKRAERHWCLQKVQYLGPMVLQVRRNVEILISF